MQDFRCHRCNQLLYQAKGEVDVEVICSKCRCINYPHRSDHNLGLRGKDFQAKAIQHICVNCVRVLFMSIGIGVIKTKCKTCHYINTYNTEAMRNKKYEMAWTENAKKIKKSLAR